MVVAICNKEGCRGGGGAARRQGQEGGTCSGLEADSLDSVSSSQLVHNIVLLGIIL